MLSSRGRVGWGQASSARRRRGEGAERMGGQSQPGRVAGEGEADMAGASKAEGAAWPGPCLPSHLPPCSERVYYLFMRLHPKGNKNCIRRLFLLGPMESSAPLERTAHTTHQQPCLLQNPRAGTQQLPPIRPLVLPLGTENAVSLPGGPRVRFKGSSVEPLAFR